MPYPKTIILRDDDDNYLIGEFVKEFKEGVPEYKMREFWGYHEGYAVKREFGIKGEEDESK